MHHNQRSHVTQLRPDAAKQINILKYIWILVFKKDPSCVLVRKNHKETDVPFNFALEISKGQWPDYIALFFSYGHKCLESTSYAFIATERSRFIMDLCFPDHPGGQLSAVPSPFFTSQSVRQASLQPQLTPALCVSLPTLPPTPSSTLPSRSSKVASLCTEMRCKLKNKVIVKYCLWMWMSVYVCLFNITAFEVRDDVTEVAHVGQMSLDTICNCWSPPSAHPLVVLSL